MPELAAGLRKRLDHPPQQVPADAGAANGDDADLLVVSVAELMPERLTVGEVGQIEAGRVAGEGVVLALASPQVVWMALFAGVMAYEKVGRHGVLVARLAGLALLVASVLVALS